MRADSLWRGRWALALLAGLLVLGPLWGRAETISALDDLQPPPEGLRIHQIDVRGNVLIAADTIRFRLATKVGDDLDVPRLRNDVKALFATGFFKDVQVDLEELPGRRARLTFIVDEKPRVGRVVFSGNEAVKDKDLHEAITVQADTVYSPTKVKESVLQIKDKYLEQGFNDVEVVPVARSMGGKKVEIEFQVDEGQKLYIQDVRFEGNEAFSDRRLRRVLKETRRHWAFSWLSGKGKFNPELLEQDLQLLSDFYMDHGYAKVRIGTPRRTMVQGTRVRFWGKDPRIVREVVLTIPIEEGPQYRFGDISVEGNEVFSKDELASLIEAARGSTRKGLFVGRVSRVRPGDRYSRTALREAVRLITDAYGQRGYIYVDPQPRQVFDDETRQVGVVFHIREGVQAFLNRLEFAGNTRTRDKVMRREVAIAEGEVFDTALLRASIGRLTYLGFLENVTPEIEPQADPTKVDVVVNVEDQRRTELQFGGGFSSVDRFFGQISLSELNLFGRGQELKLSAQTGNNRTIFRFRFSDRYFLDTRNFLSTDIFRTETRFPNFRRDSTGGSVVGGRRFFGRLDYRLGYTYEIVKIANADETDPQLQLFGPETVNSSVTQSLIWDTRDRRIEATRGLRSRLSLEVASTFLGGDTQFYKLIFDNVWYKPLPRDVVFAVHNQIRYAAGFRGGDLPVFEEFRLGGETSVRGFARDSIGPIRVDGRAGTGNKVLLTNIELVIPLAGPLKAVLFFDAGDNYGRDERFDLRTMRTSAGAELRFFVPAFNVPFRFIWGVNLDPWEGEDRTQFQFTIGTPF